MRPIIPAFLACACLSALLLPVSSPAGDATVPGRVEVPYPTIINLGIVWYIEGDDDLDGVVTVEFRKAGTDQWRKAMPLKRVPTVLTVHDLIYRLYPRYHKPMNYLYLNAAMPLYVKRANAVITISESSKRDLIRLYGIPPDKVTVIFSHIFLNVFFCLCNIKHPGGFRKNMKR